MSHWKLHLEQNRADVLLCRHPTFQSDITADLFSICSPAKPELFAELVPCHHTTFHTKDMSEDKPSHALHSGDRRKLRFTGWVNLREQRDACSSSPWCHLTFPSKQPLLRPGLKDDTLWKQWSTSNSLLFFLRFFCFLFKISSPFPLSPQVQN